MLSLFTHSSVTDALDYVDGMVGCCGKRGRMRYSRSFFCCALHEFGIFTEFYDSECIKECLVLLNLVWLHVPSVSMSSVFFFRMFSLTVANSPVGSRACASMSLKVLATVDRGTNSCRGPFLPKR